MRRITSVMLVLILSLSLFSSAYADEIEDAQKKLDKTQESIEKNKKEKEKVNKDLSDVKTQIGHMDSLINSASDKLRKLNDQIKTLDKEISNAEKEICGYEEKLDKENQLLKDRLRNIYTSGNTGYLEIILSSNGLSDLIYRIDTVKRVIDYDKKLEKNIKENKKLLVDKKDELETKRKEISAYKKDAEEQKQVLDEKLKDKKNLMASLEKNKSAYEKMISQEESESKDLQAIIKALKEQEEKKKDQGGTTGGKTSNSKYYCVTGKIYRITSPYGWRVHPVLGYSRFHAGIDIGVYTGTSIYSLTDGVVIFSGAMSGYGNVVMIDHGNIISVYAHNSSLVVSKGEKVKGGQLITYSGNTGLSSGPHLHFEIRLPGGGTTDPTPYYVK